MSDDDEQIDLDTIGGERSAMYAELMQANHNMFNMSRRQANKALKRAETYESMALQERQVAAVHLLTAKQLSELIGDTVISEFDLRMEKTGPEDDIPDDSDDEVDEY